MIINPYAYAALSYPSPSFSFYNEDNAPGSSTVTLTGYSYGYGNNVIAIYSGNQTINTVTLDGTSATSRATVALDGGAQYIQLWDVTKSASGSGSIVIGHSGTPFRTSAGLWIVGNSNFVSASAVTDTDDGEIIDLSTTLTAGDHLLGIGYLRDNSYTVGGVTVTGFTLDWDQETDSSRWTFGGHIFSAAGGSTTAQFDTNEAPPQFAAGGVAAIWRPA